MLISLSKNITQIICRTGIRIQLWGWGSVVSMGEASSSLGEGFSVIRSYLAACSDFSGTCVKTLKHDHRHVCLAPGKAVIFSSVHWVTAELCQWVHLL